MRGNVLQNQSSATTAKQIKESVYQLRHYFMHPEFSALLETVGPNGEFIDTNLTRTINPGHCIETSWFLMEEAKQKRDAELLKTALTILDLSWDWGWDRTYGGIINFREFISFKEVSLAAFIILYFFFKLS